MMQSASLPFQQRNNGTTVQQALHADGALQGAQNVEALVGGAASGVVAGFLEDWSDRATLVGLVIYLLCGAACAAVDYSFAAAAEKKKQISDNIDETEARGRGMLAAAWSKLSTLGSGADSGGSADSNGGNVGKNG